MKKIYDVQGQVNPTNSQSHIKYSFYIDEEYDSIKVFFEYFPKDLEDKAVSKRLILDSLNKYGYASDDKKRDEEKWESFMPLKNHLTLSVDDPKGFRGATHRHDYKLELIFDDKASTPGLISRKNVPGMWDITIDIHALVTESCNYKIAVMGIEKI